MSRENVRSLMHCHGAYSTHSETYQWRVEASREKNTTVSVMHACPVIKQKLETLGSLLKVFEQYSLCRSHSVSDNVTKLEHLLLIIIFLMSIF